MNSLPWHLIYNYSKLASADLLSLSTSRDYDSNRIQNLLNQKKILKDKDFNDIFCLDLISIAKVVYLYPYGKEIIPFPKQIGSLIYLEVLTISADRINSLPDSIGNLLRLRKLHIYDGSLVNLPDSLTKLTNLETLSVVRNKLTSLPTDIGKLQKLYEIDVTQNSLIDLSDRLPGGDQRNMSILHLTNLETLNIANNLLTSLPFDIGKLIKLRELKFSHNRLTSLPKSLTQLTDLRIFEYDGNRWDRWDRSDINIINQIDKIRYQNIIVK